MKNKIYIGYEPREDLAYKVLKFSIMYHLPRDTEVEVVPLITKDLRDRWLYNRSYRVLGTGQMVDDIDGKPFSTDFSFSRFLVPTLAKEEGVDGWACFIDCDFLCRVNFEEIFKELNNKFSDCPCVVVKKNFVSKRREKMDGMFQSNYNKKLWSSLMFFNMGITYPHKLSVYNVNNQDGSYLHQFKWLAPNGGEPGDYIGSLTEDFHFIPEYDEDKVAFPKLIHFTEKAPWFKGPNQLDSTNPSSLQWRGYLNLMKDTNYYAI